MSKLRDWTDLHQERRTIARERRTESLLAPAIRVGGGLALVVVLLLRRG